MHDNPAAGVEIAHFIPGRLRLRIQALKRNHASAHELQRSLSHVTGIEGIDVNPLTGSVLLLFDSRVITHLSSWQALSAALCRLFPEIFRPDRMRFRVRNLKGKETLARRILTPLLSVPGIKDIDLDVANDSVMLTYDAHLMTQLDSLEALCDVLGSHLPGFDTARLRAWLTTGERPK